MQSLSLGQIAQRFLLLSTFAVRVLLLVLPSFLLTPSAGAADPKKPDVRLVIDVSGSMKLNDPTNLRQPAVDLLVKLMPDGGKAGIWTFGMYVNMLVPHQLVDNKWREQAGGKASEINSVGLFTNIGAALDGAARDASSPNALNNANFATNIILLTDGMVDISKDPEVNKTERRRIVEEVLPKLKKAGFTVHTVALSDKADTELMEKLAIATDGTFAVARTAEDLMKIFLNAFNVAAPAQELPLQNNRFAVDSSVEDFTALIFRQKKDEKTELVGPDKKRFTAASTDEGVKWYRTDRYDLITVERPLEGEWQIVAELDPSSRITIVSDLAIRVKELPNNVFRGASTEFSFLLEEEGKTVTSAEFLSLVESNLTMDFQVGKDPKLSVFTHGFKEVPPPANGTYTVKLPTFEKIGNYDLSLVVNGKTFKRQFNHHLVVREPFSVEVGEVKGSNGASEYAIKVMSHSDKVVVDKTHAVATIVLPDTHSLVKPLTLTEIGNWQNQMKPTLPGDYAVTVQVTGEEVGKKPFSYTLDPVKFSYQPDAAFAAPAPVPEVKPVPPPEPPKVEPKPAAETKPEPPPEPKPKPEEAPKGMPAWLIYTAIGLGNLIFFGGVYLVVRKLMGGEEEAVVEDVAVTAPPQVDLEPEMTEAVMDLNDEPEEEPPMEDLESIDIESPRPAQDTQSLMDEMLNEYGNDDMSMDDGSSPSLQLPTEADDDIDDLDDMLIEQVTGKGTDSEKAKFADEILKAQGLDLPEHKLDEAISSLIDDLDGTRPEPLEERRDDDFDDEENWDKMS